MLLNNLDPEVAERPEELVVYGGSGKAARNHEALRAIVRSLLDLGDDETLLVQSGKPVGVFRTHPGAPRVLIANAMLVPRWATWEEFRRLEALGLTMFGQMTAGQLDLHRHPGDPPGHVPDFRRGGGEALRRRRPRRADGPDRRARRHGRRAAAGGAMADAAMLCVEVDPSRIQRRLETRYLDEATDSLDEALARVRAAQRGAGLSVGLLGNAAEVVPELARRGERFDLVTDQTAAHDPLTGYVPQGLSVEDAARLRESDPDEYLRRAGESIAVHVEGMLEHVRAGSTFSTMGTTCAARPRLRAWRTRSHTRGSSRPTSGRSSVAATGRSAGPSSPATRPTSRRSTTSCAASSPTTRSCSGGSRSRRSVSRSRGCRHGSAGSATVTAPVPGSRSTNSSAPAACGAPVVIGRDHLDSGSVASPYRETESMRDGSDAIADWPILNALLNTAAGATWVSVHHGGGVGIGNSIHAGMVVVADGTDDAAERLERVLTTDPGTGILRHADAGYEDAVDAAREHGLDLPGPATA